MTRAVLFIRNLPTAVKTAFKSTCARRGDPMVLVTEALMRLYAAQPELIEPYLRKMRKESEVASD